MLERRCAPRNKEGEIVKIYFIAALIGICIGIIDIIPMIIQKLPKRSTVSAFLQYVFVSIIVFFIDFPGIIWWIEGSIIALCLSIPIIIIASEEDKNAKYIIGSMSIILGFIISISKYFFI
jgi:hypothetical protein